MMARRAASASKRPSLSPFFFFFPFFAFASTRVTRSDLQVYQAISQRCQATYRVAQPHSTVCLCYQMLGHLMNNKSRRGEKNVGTKKKTCDEREGLFTVFLHTLTPKPRFLTNKRVVTFLNLCKHYLRYKCHKSLKFFTRRFQKILHQDYTNR